MPFGVYVHIPFCASRCGYCDFNTYTATELGASVVRETFHRHLITEVAMAGQRLGPVPADTVFFGGGTPSLLGAAPLIEILRAIDDHLGLADDVEVTCEVNPDSVDQEFFDQLRQGGFTRISIGMQSASNSVLRILERTHTPGAAARAAQMARSAGFAHVSMDLIYGTPSETDDDVRTSVALAVAAEVDHISAYALIVEDGTPLARRVQSGQIAQPDDDVAADRYELIDQLLTDAGFTWYEVSNWSRAGGQCRHNLGYWRNDQWWGIGPGAHSFIGGHRWWNHKHPQRYVQGLLDGDPRAGIEQPDERQRQMETVMLGVRLREGLAIADVPDPKALADLVGKGQVQVSGDRVQLTASGRLLADAVVRDLLGD